MKALAIVFVGAQLCISPAIADAFPQLDAIMAEERDVTVTNNSDDAIKACFYNGDDITAILPKGCIIVDAGESEDFDREKSTGPYGVKIFKPGIVDGILAAQLFANPYPFSGDITDVAFDGKELNGRPHSIADRLTETGPHIEDVWLATKTYKAFEDFCDNDNCKLGVFDSLTFHNDAKSKRKVCVYRDDDAHMTIGLKCWILKAGENAVWDIADRPNYGVRTFIPKLFDKSLKRARHMGGTSEIRIGQKGEMEAIYPAIPKKLSALGVRGAGSFRYWNKAHSQKLTYMAARTPDILFLVIRGTNANLEENIRLNASGWPPRTMYPQFLVPPVLPPFVHVGWWTASEAVAENFDRAIADMRGNRRVILLGHSLGGALATYVAYRLLQDYGGSYPLHLVITGGPHDGNTIIHNAFSRAEKRGHFKAYSVEMRGDWAPTSWPVGERIGTPVNLDVSEDDDDLSSDLHDYNLYHAALESRFAKPAPPEPGNVEREITRGDRIWWLAADYGFADPRDFVAVFERLNPGVDANRVYAGRSYVFPPPEEG